MKTVFELLRDIHFDKSDYKLAPDDEFNPYMICRWISMVSPVYAAIINQIYNENYKAFSDKQMLFDYLKIVLPKKNIFKVDYIKKQTAKIDKNDASLDELKYLADVLEIPIHKLKDILRYNPEIKINNNDELLLYKAT